LKTSGKLLNEYDEEFTRLSVYIYSSVNKTIPYHIGGDLSDYVQTHFKYLKSDKEMMPGVLHELQNLDLGVASPAEMQAFVVLLQKILDCLKSVGVKDGYIAGTDFSNPDKYPFISCIVPRILDYDFKLDVKSPDYNKIIKERKANPITFYHSLLNKGLNPNHCAMFYDSMVNLVVLHLFGMLHKCISIIDKDP
jgi:hypothetical protein